MDLAAPAAPSPSSLTAVAPPSPRWCALVAAGPAEVAARDALLERLRRDRDAHFHGQIWTQDAAGGYARAPASTAAVEASGELGAAYRRLPSRPTTNFVGDAMMAGSIDLIRDELRQGGPGGSAPPARLPWPEAPAAGGGDAGTAGGEPSGALDLTWPTQPPASAEEAAANVERMRLLLVRRRAAPAVEAPPDAQQRRK
jgi:hypothetical protein